MAMLYATEIVLREVGLRLLQDPHVVSQVTHLFLQGISAIVVFLSTHPIILGLLVAISLVALAWWLVSALELV